MSFVLGIDVGTQSSKGVLVSDQGKVEAVASAPHRVRFPRSGWAEQDPQEWTTAVAAVIGELAGSAQGEITHICVDAQVDGVVATGPDLEPLHPALIWMDRRATAHTGEIEASVGRDRVFEVTGLNCDPSHGAPKMMWLLDHLEHAPAHLLAPTSFVNAWLTGEVAQDEANASSSMLFDVTRREWSEPLLEASGIDTFLLPPVVDSVVPIGTVRAALTAELGLPAGCQVLAGTGDDHAAAVGAGAARPGVVADITGTAEPIGVAADRPVFDPGRLLETHAHAVPGAWFIENPGFVSGGSLLWAASLLGVRHTDLFELADGAPAGSRGLVFIPALSGAMSPRWNEHARGSLTGAAMNQGRAELARAVIEGCSFALRDNVDRVAELGLPADRIHVTGGGARSPLWLQIKADVIGRTVVPIAGEGAALGAACLAATTAGWFSDVPSAADALVSFGPQSYSPRQTESEVYEAAYRRYRATYDALEPTYIP